MLVDGDSAVVVSFVEWIAHIRLHYPLLCCSDHLPCAFQHAKRANTSLKECYGRDAVVTWRRVMVTIAASRVWALNTQRRLLWTSHAPIAGG